MRLTRNNVLKLLLSDLETLTNAENAYEVYDKLRTDKAKQYVEGLKYSKPESLLADKLFKPLIDVLKLFSLPEPVAGEGWVDFLIREGINPPVAIELKALHDKNGKKVSLDKKYGELKSLFDKNKTNQIITYLKDFDYVILTNLDDVYYFNREAVYDFKPFRKEKFKEFIKDLREIGDIWELARRKEDETPKKDLDEIFFEDLKRWYSKLANLKWKKNENEAIVLLLNKLIFIRTLEDFALIPFRFLQTTYLEKKDRWNAKGSKTVHACRKLINISILDPACGSGSFLIKVVRGIYDIYLELDRKTEWATRFVSFDLPADMEEKLERGKKIREILGFDNLDRKKLLSLIVLRHIYGVDLDERAVDVAKVNIWKEVVKLSPNDFRYSKFRNHLIEVFKRWEDEKGVNYIGNPLFYPLEFFHLYFDENGEPLPKEKWGFDGVIGNPPWENIKPYSKEFAGYHPEIFGEISKFSIDGPTFKKLFAKKMKDPRVKALWDEYERKIKSLSEFIRSRFRLYGKGDLSYQKVFLERAMELSKNAVVLLVPSNFHTDEGAMLLRKEIFENYCLKELISFENRAHGWFKDIDPRFKFDIVFFTKEKCDKPFKAAFYVTRSDYEEWGAENGGSFSDFLKAVTFEYPVNLIPKISPDVLGVVEFRSEKDVAMVQKIRKDWKFLRDYEWDIKREFDMARDNDLFNTKGRGLVLYEGKMIHQYEPFFSEPRYWVEEEKGRSRLLSKELSRIKRFLKSEGERLGLNGKKLEEFVKDNLKMAIENFEKSIFKLDYEDYRLAYRAIARSTDERTLISCILPPKVFMGHSLNYFKPYYYAIEDGVLVQRKRSYEDTVYLMALLNSFVLDYYIRQRVSANLTMFFLYELPIPDVSEKLKQEVVEKAFRLLYRKDVYDDMAKELGMKVNEIKDENKRRELRAELEIIIARDVFGLTREDVEFILSTFVYGNPDRELMKMVVEMFDNFPAVV